MQNYRIVIATPIEVTAKSAREMFSAWARMRASYARPAFSIPGVSVGVERAVDKYYRVRLAGATLMGPEEFDKTRNSLRRFLLRRL